MSGKKEQIDFTSCTQLSTFSIDLKQKYTLFQSVLKSYEEYDIENLTPETAEKISDLLDFSPK